MMKQLFQGMQAAAHVRSEKSIPSTYSFFGWLIHSPILHRTALALVVLAWSSLVSSCRHDPNVTALHDAVQAGDVEKVKSLVDNNPDLVSSKDSNGLTPLHIAALKGNNYVVAFLVASKADVNAKANNGSMPLHYAAQEGHRDVAEMLLTHGADVNARNASGLTPLSVATAEAPDEEVNQRRRAVAELLRQHGGHE